MNKDDKNLTPKRIAFFLPNIFTALNMACGFASILLSINNQFYYATLVLLLGSLFDSVDGRIARLTGTQSSFGEQFDSLSDMISFGMAPAILTYLYFFQDLGKLGQLVSFLYLLSGALRLARFNANIDKISNDFFQGLPIPSAAIGTVGCVLLCLKFSFLLNYKIYFLALVFFYSILMVSNLPFYSFKNIDWLKKHKRATLVLIFLFLGLL